MLEYLMELLQNNDVFTGVAVGGLITSVALTFFYSLKNVPNLIYTFLKRHLTITMVVHNRESLYDNFNKWLYQFEKDNLRTYQLKSGNYSSFLKKSYNTLLKHNYDLSNSESFLLTPGIGKHFVWYNKRPLLIQKNITKENTDGVIEEIEITTFGRTKNTIKNIITEIENITNYKENIKLYVNDSYHEWTLTDCSKIPLKSIIFNNKYNVIEKIKNFFDRKDWYFDKGLRHKLGILLTGKPGTGKSKFVSTIASELNLPIYMLNLNSIEKDYNLHELIRDIPPHSILLIEDIDCFCVSNERQKDKSNNNKISLSALLNILDGITSPNEIIYILTTNYPETLDKALIRDGRIDLFYELNDFNKESMKEMYDLYINDEDFENFYKELNVETINPANLQSILLEKVKNI